MTAPSTLPAAPTSPAVAVPAEPAVVTPAEPAAPATPAVATPTKAAPTKAAPTKAAPTKAATTKAAPTKAAPTKAAPTKAAPPKAAPTKAAPTKAAAAKAAVVAKGVRKPEERPVRSAAETEKIRTALSDRLVELRAEYEQTMGEIAEAQRDRLTDSAGDDQADTGTKTFEREQEITLANNLRERVGQVERALDRLDDGQYGWCERCGNAIPVERLAAFPSATLCVTCKQLEERR
jgi:RNA polymerase-binding protein DksA